VTEYFKEVYAMYTSGSRRDVSVDVFDASVESRTPFEYFPDGLKKALGVAVTTLGLLGEMADHERHEVVARWKAMKRNVAGGSLVCFGDKFDPLDLGGGHVVTGYMIQMNTCYSFLDRFLGNDEFAGIVTEDGLLCISGPVEPVSFGRISFGVHTGRMKRVKKPVASLERKEAEFARFNATLKHSRPDTARWGHGRAVSHATDADEFVGDGHNSQPVVEDYLAVRAMKFG